MWRVRYGAGQIGTAIPVCRSSSVAVWVGKHAELVIKSVTLSVVKT